MPSLEAPPVRAAGSGRERISWVNVPIGAPKVSAAMIVLSRDRPGIRARLDGGGVGLQAIAMMLLAVPLLEGRDAGWPAWIGAGLALAAPAFWTFHRLEHRVQVRGRDPLVRPSLFNDAGTGAGVVTTMLEGGNVLGVARSGLLFFMLLGSGRARLPYVPAYALALPACAVLLLAAALLYGWRFR
jgi:hypothetical protein